MEELLLHAPWLPCDLLSRLTERVLVLSKRGILDLNFLFVFAGFDEEKKLTILLVYLC